MEFLKLTRQLRTLFQRTNPRLVLLSCGAGLALTAILMNFKLMIFEASLYDFRMRAQGAKRQSPRVALIAIDDATTDALDEAPPLHMQQHLQLLKLLSRSGAKAVAFMVDFNKALNEGDATSLEQKSRSMIVADEFTATAKASAKAGVPVLLGTDFDVTGEVLPPSSLQTIPRGLAIIHKDSAAFSEDKVSRRGIYAVNGEKTVHAQLAELTNGKRDASQYDGLSFMPEVNARFFLINFRGSTQETRPPFPQYSFIDVLKGLVPVSAFKDKIVIIGAKSETNSNDYAYTPFAREFFTNPKLGIHGHIVETLIHDDALKPSPLALNAAITFLLTACIVWLVFNTSPALGVGITMMLCLGYTALALFFFKFSNLALDMSHPLLGIFFAYYVSVPYRLIVEFKQKADFQRKHEVLMQVDELKGNFMSLITHDLKTPVARIQGMAEMLGRSGSDPNIVNQIVTSTDELNRFITMILELAKVESNHIQLQRSSKDVNRLIEECVRKLTFQATRKDIKLETDLEPLFPIAVDLALVGKILANLVDNAIKYSPEGPTETIATKESTKRPGFVEVTVKDEGYGIRKADQQNLFHKFYRPHNDQTMQSKGYGLGLYLSRFFAEMHGGGLEVVSDLGKGSTFSLYLPIHAAADLEPQSGGKTGFMTTTQIPFDKGETHV